MAAGRKSSGAEISMPYSKDITSPNLPRACKVTSPESDTLPGHSYYRRARGGWEASFPWAEPPLRLAIVTFDARWRAGTALYYIATPSDCMKICNLRMGIKVSCG